MLGFVLPVAKQGSVRIRRRRREGKADLGRAVPEGVVDDCVRSTIRPRFLIPPTSEIALTVPNRLTNPAQPPSPTRAPLATLLPLALILPLAPPQSPLQIRLITRILRRPHLTQTRFALRSRLVNVAAEERVFRARGRRRARVRGSLGFRVGEVGGEVVACVIGGLTVACRCLRTSYFSSADGFGSEEGKGREGERNG